MMQSTVFWGMTPYTCRSLKFKGRFGGKYNPFNVKETAKREIDVAVLPAT